MSLLIFSRLTVFVGTLTLLIYLFYEGVLGLGIVITVSLIYFSALLAHIWYDVGHAAEHELIDIDLKNLKDKTNKNK